MALVKHTSRYDHDHDHDHDHDDEWGDNLSEPATHQLYIINRLSTPWSSELSTHTPHQCETAKSFNSVEWRDNRDPIHEWDRNLYWTADIADHTLGDLLHFMWQDTPTRPSPSLRKRFERLAQQWVFDTMFYSSSHDIIMHWAYQQVIGLGPQVLPLIYEKMVAGDLHWTWALSAIVGDDPAADIDSPRAATDVWIRWIEDHHRVGQSSVFQ